MDSSCPICRPPESPCLCRMFFTSTHTSKSLDIHQSRLSKLTSDLSSKSGFNGLPEAGQPLHLLYQSDVSPHGTWPTIHRCREPSDPWSPTCHSWPGLRLSHQHLSSSMTLSSPRILSTQGPCRRTQSD